LNLRGAAILVGQGLKERAPKFNQLLLGPALFAVRLWNVAPGRGRKPLYAAEKVGQVVDATLQTQPKAPTGAVAP